MQSKGQDGLENCNVDAQKNVEGERFIQRILNSVLLAPAPQGGLIDAENIGSLLQRFGCCKHAPDMQLFDFFQVN